MDSFAEVVIRGRLGTNKDGEVLTPKTAGDSKYWRFSLGVEKKRYIKDTNTTVVGTDWISCTCWDERVVQKGFTKNQVVQVTGKLTTYGEKVEGAEFPKTRLAVVAERVQAVTDPNDSWDAVPSRSVATRVA